MDQDLPTVFIVDDDAGVRHSIEDLLESVGLRCKCFASAQEFLSAGNRSRPSCLVLDVRLPGISGLDFSAN
jgi:FixJ family two-component response regulator